jgi:hypothetical protein
MKYNGPPGLWPLGIESGLNARRYQTTKYQNVDKIYTHQTHASHFDTHRRQVGRDRVGKTCLNHQ